MSNQLENLINNLLKIADDPERSDTNKREGYKFLIREYATSALNLHTNIQLTSIGYGDYEYRIKDFKQKYNLEQNLDGKFY